MLSPEQKYRDDVLFHNMVHALLETIRDGRCSAEDVRDAAFLASVMARDLGPYSRDTISGSGSRLFVVGPPPTDRTP